jgi:hypothetical protein
MTNCLKSKKWFKDLMTELSKSKNSFEFPKIEFVIQFEAIWLFWSMCVIIRMANFMIAREIMENDVWNQTQKSESIVLHKTKVSKKKN